MVFLEAGEGLPAGRHTSHACGQCTPGPAPSVNPPHRKRPTLGRGAAPLLSLVAANDARMNPEGAQCFTAAVCAWVTPDFTHSFSMEENPPRVRGHLGDSGLGRTPGWTGGCPRAVMINRPGTPSLRQEAGCGGRWASAPAGWRDGTGLPGGETTDVPMTPSSCALRRLSAAARQAPGPSASRRPPSSMSLISTISWAEGQPRPTELLIGRVDSLSPSWTDSQGLGHACLV